MPGRLVSLVKNFPLINGFSLSIGYSEGELNLIGDTLVKLQPSFVFDWGTYGGWSARIFYEASKLYGYECKVCTTDLPNNESNKSSEFPGELLGILIKDVQVHQYRGDGVTVSLGIFKQYSPEKVLFFVDGDHTSNNVFRELDLIFSAAPRAVILCHDIKYIPSFSEFVELHKSHYTLDIVMSDAGLGRLWPK